MRTKEIGGSERWSLVAVLAIYLVLSARLLRVISRYSANIFFGDAWAFDYQLLSKPQSLWSMFRLQYGPHRQGVGAIFSFLIGSWSAWDSRVEMLVLGAVVVVAAGCALYLKVRLYGPIAFSDAIIPMVILTPSQFGGFASYFNPAHGPFPELLVVLYCLAWTLHSARWKYPCILLVNFAMTYTGFGLFIGVLTPLFLAVDFCRKRRGEIVAAFLLSLASLGSFFVGYRVDPAIACYGSPSANPVSFHLAASFGYLHFMCLMFANFIALRGVAIYPAIFGGLTLAAVLIATAFATKDLLKKNTLESTRLVPAALLSYCLLFTLFTGIGRLCAGLNVAQSARYMPYVAVGLLGVYFQLLLYRVRIGVAALFGVLLWSSISIKDRGAMIWTAQKKREWRTCYLSVNDVDRCNQLTQFRIDLDPDSNHVRDRLDFLKQHQLNLFRR